MTKVWLNTALLFFIVTLFIASTLNTYGEEVIDLGNLEIKGEVRRPSVQFYQLKQLDKEKLKNLTELSFTELEEEIFIKPEEERQKK